MKRLRFRSFIIEKFNGKIFLKRRIKEFWTRNIKIKELSYKMVFKIF